MYLVERTWTARIPYLRGADVTGDDPHTRLNNMIEEEYNSILPDGQYHDVLWNTYTQSGFVILDQSKTCDYSYYAVRKDTTIFKSGGAYRGWLRILGIPPNMTEKTVGFAKYSIELDIIEENFEKRTDT